MNAFACQQLSLESGLTHPQSARNSLRHLVWTAAECRVCVSCAGDYDRRCRRNNCGRSGSAVRRRVRFSISRRRSPRHELNLESLAQESISTRSASSCSELRGVGRWTAEYALLRGFGRLQVFPGDDVGAQKKLARWLGRSRPLDYAGVARAVAPWQPYAGLVYFHLLLHGLSLAGAFESAPRRRLRGKAVLDRPLRAHESEPPPPQHDASVAGQPRRSVTGARESNGITDADVLLHSRRDPHSTVLGMVCHRPS